MVESREQIDRLIAMNGEAHVEIIALRAEVESLREERDAAYQQGVNDGEDSSRNTHMQKVESLQAQLAHQQTLFVLAERVVTNAESALAAVRTDLSVARAERDTLIEGVERVGWGSKTREGWLLEQHKMALSWTPVYRLSPEVEAVLSAWKATRDDGPHAEETGR